MSYYLSLTRAKESLPSFSGSDSALLHLVHAATDTVEKYLNRKVLAATYDEVYSSWGDGQLIVDQFPISEVTRLSYAPFPVLRLGVGSPLMGTRATVQTKSDRLVLSVQGNDSIPLLFADYPTLGDLVTHLTGLGWLASASFPTMPSTELSAFPGVFNARGTVGLKAFTQDCWSMRFDGESGIVYAPIPRGTFNTRIIYRAGWEEGCVPESIIQATAELAKATYLDIDRDPSVSSLTIESYSVSQQTAKTWDNLGLVSKYGLNLYRSRTPARWREGGSRL